MGTSGERGEGEHGTSEDRVEGAAGGSPSIENLLAEHLLGTGAKGLDLEALIREHPGREQELRQVGAVLFEVLDAFRSGGHPETEDVKAWYESRTSKGEDDDPPSGGRSGSSSFPSASFLRRFTVQRAVHSRYSIQNEVARGGMGTILRAFDNDLFRTVAMKVAHGSNASSHPQGKTSVLVLERFLTEAQITGQLEHPGIMPVHDLGLDENERVFFTMPLVRGSDLKQVLAEYHTGSSDWTLPRVLEVLLKVCDAVGFAHSRRVLHRDLKPSNIMVGRSGEVYVVDWGLAHILGTEDPRDLRIQDADVHTRIAFDARFSEDNEEPLQTLDGEVLGTPAYMSPEQARGEIETMDAPSDVYAVGAILYEILAGHAPYAEGQRTSPRRIWMKVIEGAPRSLEHTTTHEPPELIAICDKAMARRMEDRYEDTAAMAADLRAFLDGRVVAAHRTGAWTELSKWTRRNRGVAGALAALVVVLLGAIGVVASIQSRRAVEANRHSGRLEVLLAHEHGQRLLEEAAGEWSLTEADRERIANWKKDVLELERTLRTGPGTNHIQAAERKGTPEVLEGVREDLRERILEYRMVLARKKFKTSEQKAVLEGELAVLEELAESQVLRSESKRKVLPGSADEDELEALAREGLERALHLLVDGPGSWSARLDTHLERIEQQRAASEHPMWPDVLEDLRLGGESYASLVIPPQEGLIPLGRNTESGLHEFLHVLSGDRPETDVKGRHVVAPETGIVLVLLPGGETRVGAQWAAKEGPNHDPLSRRFPGWGPTIEGSLSPFFLAKHELTQDQYLRLAGARPSEVSPGTWMTNDAITTGSHPVERITWEDAREALTRSGLSLPTEAQWEYGARGEVKGPHWFDVEDASFYCNSEGETDGWRLHAPVDSYEPNLFGLYNVLGNVREWCRGPFLGGLEGLALDPATGEFMGSETLEILATELKPWRGGGWRNDLETVRVTARYGEPRYTADYDLGVRAARPVRY